MIVLHTPRYFFTAEAFYNDRQDRRRGLERDFGVWWTIPGQDFPRWRLSWIESTQELYAVAMDRPSSHVNLPFPVEIVSRDGLGMGPVILCASLSHEKLHDVLEGWGAMCMTPGSLSWLWNRLGIPQRETARG